MGSAVKLGGGANGSADRTNSGIGGRSLAGPDESTPLINGGHAGSDGNGDGPGFWRQVLLDPRHTPGTDSQNHAVRYSAHVFNVTKATLLSSTSHRTRPGGNNAFPLCIAC